MSSNDARKQQKIPIEQPSKLIKPIPTRTHVGMPQMSMNNMPNMNGFELNKEVVAGYQMPMMTQTASSTLNAILNFMGSIPVVAPGQMGGEQAKAGLSDGLVLPILNPDVHSITSKFIPFMVT